MGGAGSGNFYRASKKTTVENCLSIDAPRWTREGILKAGVHHHGSWRWTYRSGSSFAVHYDVDSRDVDAPSVQLAYSWTWPGAQAPEHESYTVGLTTTRPHYGGRRWWFLCPACGRRAGKLHLPPRARRFACRRCHDLTYTSCQESGKAEWLYRTMAAGMGCTPREVKRILRKACK